MKTFQTGRDEKSRRHIAHVTALFASVGLLLTAACETTDSSQPDQARPTSSAIPRIADATSVMSARWSSRIDVGVLSAEGTFVRGAVESMESMLVFFTSAVAYPGFARANESDRFQDMGPIFSYDNGKTMQLAAEIANARATNSRTSTVDVCVSATTVVPGRVDTRPPSRGLFTLTIDKNGQQPPANQSGQGRRPAGNVFGGWKLTGLEINFFSEGETPSPLCDYAALAGQVGRPAVPGWPAASPSSSSSVVPSS
jgi:hypothetical protein